MLISAFIALTLSPALCAVFLRHGRRHARAGGLDADRGSTRSARRVFGDRRRGCCGWRRCRCWRSQRRAWAFSCWGKVTPTGFLPEEDQGAIFHRGAASRRRLGGADAGRRARRWRTPDQADAAGGGGAVDRRVFIAGRGQPAERGVPGDAAEAVRGAGWPADNVRAVLGHIFGAAQQIRSATVFPFNLPPIIGLSTSGGFEYQLENLEGRPPEDMASVMQGLDRPRRRTRIPALNRVFSTFTGVEPVDLAGYRPGKGAGARAGGSRTCSTRCRPRWAGTTSTISILFGRTWQVNLQGDAIDRSDPAAIYKIYVRNKSGEMVPLRSIANIRIQLGPQVISRYNNYRSVTINGSPKPGVSSGDALAAMDQISRTTLPPGYTYEWTGTAYQEREASGQTGVDPGAGGAVRVPVPGGAV